LFRSVLKLRQVAVAGQYEYGAEHGLDTLSTADADFGSQPLAVTVNVPVELEELAGAVSARVAL